MVEMIQRDKTNLLDAMLVAINANDRVNFNMQHNVIPVAMAKNMGVIGMKVFADGAMYTKEAHWTRGPVEVVRTVGNQTLPSRPLVEYTLSTPGVHTAIIGIGQISDDPALCQLEQNLSAAQINPSSLNDTDRMEVEKMTRVVKEGKTNYFQLPDRGLTAPGNFKANQRRSGADRIVELSWDTAFAGNVPLKTYEVWRDDKKVGSVNHKPQTSKAPFVLNEKVSDGTSHAYSVVAVDTAGRQARSETARVENI